MSRTRCNALCVAAQSRDPVGRGNRCCMGPGSAAHRRRDAALRPGHKTVLEQWTHLHPLAACFARALLRRLTLMKEGAGKTGCRLAPAVHCARVQSEDLHSGIQVKPKHPAFPAQWFDGLCRALPGERCTIAPVALRMADARARLGRTHHHKTWRTGSGRQDHTILPYADHTGRARDGFAHGRPPCKTLRADATSVHRRPARVRDDRDTPLFLGPG